MVDEPMSCPGQLTLLADEPEHCLVCGAPFRWTAPSDETGIEQGWYRRAETTRRGLRCADRRACSARSAGDLPEVETLTSDQLDEILGSPISSDADHDRHVRARAEIQHRVAQTETKMALL